jgi:hypothetical protein
MTKAMTIGTSLTDSLLSLVTALKFGGINPAPDTTKRETALKLIAKGSWPSMRESIRNALLTRSITSQKELNLGIVAGYPPATYNG